MLPLPVQSSPKAAVRALLSHCFYRRVIIWAITATVLLCLMLFSGGVHTHHGRILDHLVDFGQGDTARPFSTVNTTPNPSDGNSDSSVGDKNHSESPSPEKAANSDTESYAKEYENDTPQNQQSYNHGGIHWLKYEQ